MLFDDVRLVIWDLDETFWRGTFTEGGIEQYIESHHDLVVKLAQRGIISTICSKNDYEPIRHILEQHKLWEYFVFPSIDWTPKGPRLKHLIDKFKLRPQNVLFIDDNPGNRAEAETCVSDLHTAGPEAIPMLAEAAPRIGKDDQDLSRLNQYRMLEARHADEASVGGDNLAFLRGSDIQVHFEYDVIPHMDRVIELINRTNQLNFTKRRLPEMSEAAIEDLVSKLKSPWVQSMLVRVTDKYGDYGYTGFVLCWIADGGRPGTLEHFCFSCRTLGMHIEKWVYDRIGRPNIDIVGPVASDLLKEQDVDWVRMGTGALASGSPPSFPEIRFVGSCDLDALSAYLAPRARRCTVSTSITRPPLWVRRDVTSHLLLPPNLWEDSVWLSFLENCGLTRDDFVLDAFQPVEKGALFVYSPLGDISNSYFRHKPSGATLLMNYRSFPARVDVLSDADFEHCAKAAELDEQQTDIVRRGIAELKQHAEFVGNFSPEMWEANLRRLAARIPTGSTVVYLAIPRTPELGDAPERYNQILRKIAAERGDYVFDFLDYVFDPSERPTWNHFQRIVYHRLANAILETLTP